VESDRFVRWFDDLAAIGRTSAGGWRRFAWTPEDRAARGWFRRTAGELDLDVETDRNGNLWAWWGRPPLGGGDGGAGAGGGARRRTATPGAVVTGSHLDTVAEGGAYDGALGIVSGFAAVDELRRRHGPGDPPRPLAVVAFADEEGGRFNVPCFGSRLLTGALEPATVLDRTDADGVALRDALDRSGEVDPDDLGRDRARLATIEALVELHIEQGRALAELDRVVAVGTVMWPHGRWRLVLTGEANHAGTTRLRDRRDPLVVAGYAVVAARARAVREGMVATVSRLVVEPNSPNSIPGRVTAALDARAPGGDRLDHFVDGWGAWVRDRAADHGVDVELTCDARTAGVEFSGNLHDRIAARLSDRGVAVASLATAAGHDAGVLAHHVPAAMLFVRNPTGASHTPTESASVADCLAGVEALTTVLEDLVFAG
jgi:N-carbamoyl-L-amino-acid hydrolase